MGGPRASTIRQIRYGLRCAVCERFLGMEGTQGKERRCANCTPRPHRIYAIYFHRDGWVVNFLHEDLKTSAGRIHTFQDFSAIAGMFNRRGIVQGEDPVDMEEGRRKGRGSFWMMLSDEDLARLKR